MESFQTLDTTALNIQLHHFSHRAKMAIEEIFIISKPELTFLPETETSKPVILEPYHVDLLPEYSYVSEEFLISGIAHSEPYCTRLLLRHPASFSKFSGLVVEEPSHLWGGTSIWRHINRWFMRNGECSRY
jgi:hypothetical protein